MEVPTTGISVAHHSYDTVHKAPESETYVSLWGEESIPRIKSGIE